MSSDDIGPTKATEEGNWAGYVDLIQRTTRLEENQKNFSKERAEFKEDITEKIAKLEENIAELNDVKSQKKGAEQALAPWKRWGWNFLKIISGAIVMFILQKLGAVV